MGITRKLITWGGACAFVLLLGSGAHAQLTSAEKKCLDGYNNKLRLVGQQAGKDYRTCNKNAGKGTEPNPNTCVNTDGPGKIAGKEQKVCDLYTALKCTGAEPIQQGCAAGNTALVTWSKDLVKEIFGDPITATISPGKSQAKCQDKAYQRAEQLFTEKLKEFRACKKAGMASGAIVNSLTLELACMHDTQPIAIPDPNGKITGKVTKLLGDVAANCGPPVIISAQFPGDCSGSATPAALGACIERLVECKVCKALNDADGMATDCDLFDDGLANGSCGIVLHKCVLDTTPTTDSQISIHIAALPVPLTFPLSGALDIGAAGAAATCDIQMLNPVNIPAIGFVCISPATGCATGERWCGPGAGPALGIDVQSDGNAGACTSAAACDALAPAACLTFGASYVPLSQTCTGFCSGGAKMACTTDAQCASAGQDACNGPNPVTPAQANICQLSCINTSAHGPSVPGAIQCNLGSNLNVENAAPCDGTDTLIAVGTTCIPVSTEEASSKITDANFTPGSTVPPFPNVNDILGASVACATLDTSVVTGLRGVGAVNFFGSALGDLAVGIQSTCL